MDLKPYFKKAQLIPAIIVDDTDGTVLMLAYMNEESLRRTMETGYTWFWSRSRQELWNKGATSGHTQKVVSIIADCDDDTLLIRVHQTGPACHTGSRSGNAVLFFTIHLFHLPRSFFIMSKAAWMSCGSICSCWAWRAKLKYTLSSPSGGSFQPISSCGSNRKA